jgi:hypothetical protein
VRYLDQHPGVDVVYGDCDAVDIEGRFIAMSYVRDWDLDHAVVNCDYCIPQPTSFIRRRVLEKVGWLDEAFISKKDHELWLRIGLVGTIQRLPHVLARERIGPGYLAQRGGVTARACAAHAKVRHVTGCAVFDPREAGTGARSGLTRLARSGPIPVIAAPSRRLKWYLGAEAQHNRRLWLAAARHRVNGRSPHS